MRNVLLGALLVGATTVTVGASAAAQTTPIKSVLFKNGLSSPIYVTAPRNNFDNVYIVERGGRIKVFDRVTGAQLSTFLDISALTTTAGERGLLSMAFHPQYDIDGANKKFYLYYTNSAGNIVIAQYTANTALAANPAGTILITIPHPSFSNHNGGTLAFGKDGFLYFAPGDGGSGNDPNNNAANINSGLGKMLRIDVDNPQVSPPLPYGIPATNPFAGAASGLKEIYSIGLRNPFRFSFDRNTGDLYIGDVGQNAVEELNFLSANYVPAVNNPRTFGWRCFEGNNQTNLAGCTYPNPYPYPYNSPFHTVTSASARSITGGVVYRGSAMPDWRGTYFFGDYVFDQIWTLKYQGVANPPVTNRTATLNPGGGLSILDIVNFGEDAFGEIYICDLGGGEVFKIVPVTPTIVGVASYGTGTPGCSGAIPMSTNTSPTVNNLGFRLQATSVPQSSLGLAIVTDQQDIIGGDPFGLGVLFHVGFGGGTVLGFDAFSDASSFGFAPAPISNDPLLANITVYAQTLWAFPTNQCVLGGANFANLATSNALTITIQP